MAQAVTHTSSLGSSVGAPWEILRSNNVTLDGRVIDFYTKSGGLGEYNAQFVLVPDFDLVLTILTAGPTGVTVDTLLSQTISAMIPAIEQANKDEARRRYAGFYQTASAQETATMQLSVDDGPGLKISKWTTNTGADIFQEFPALLAANVSGRMYPTDLTAGTETAWRAIFSIDRALTGNEQPSPFVQSGCGSWSGIDGYVFGYKALDEFVIRLHDEGDLAMSVESRALRTTMKKCSL